MWTRHGGRDSFPSPTPPSAPGAASPAATRWANERQKGRFPGRAMIEIADIRYCRLGTADLGATLRFATAYIGLETVGRADGTAWVRGDDRDHNIAYFEGAPARTAERQGGKKCVKTLCTRW